MATRSSTAQHQRHAAGQRASSVTTRTPGSTSRLDTHVASFHSGAPTPANVASYMRARAASMSGTFVTGVPLAPDGAAAQVARPQRCGAA